MGLRVGTDCKFSDIMRETKLLPEKLLHQAYKKVFPDRKQSFSRQEIKKQTSGNILQSLALNNETVTVNSKTVALFNETVPLICFFLSIFVILQPE